MARFIFELQAVLKQRLAVERERQLRVALIERERLDQEWKIRSIHVRIENEKRELATYLHAEQSEGGVDIRGVRLQASSSLSLVGRAQREVLVLAGIHKRLDEARLHLLEATTARKAVEKLKERRWEAWREVQRGVEARALDEIAVMRGARGGDDEFAEERNS
jgi:flagellar biosynthesis chaperone FliJ